MNTTTIPIDADVEDTYLKNEQEWMCRIVDAAHKFDTVVINLSEGAALEELNYKGKKFLKILKELCESNNWQQTKFKFRLPNLTQDTSVWPDISHGGSAIVSIKNEQNIFLGIDLKNLDIKKKILDKTFGIFIHRSSWDRLLISSHLYLYHKDKTLQTYHKSLDNPEDMINLDLDRLFWLLSSNKKLTNGYIKQISYFLTNLPILQNGSWKRIQQKDTVDENIMQCYNHIFVDIVCEKMVTGQTFFPTEKTARPLATKTPFLIMSAPNYIKNLRRLGFRSFGQFWDESYDYQQGVQRVESIQRIIDDLAKLTQDQLQNLYQKMTPILEHNYKTYMLLTTDKIKSVFIV